MQFTNSQTLSGAATIIFDGAGNSVITEPRLLPSTATTLTIADSVVVRGGRGTVGNPFATLIIDGTVSADTDTIDVTGSNVTNNGLLEALNGHEVVVKNLNSTPGTLHAGAGSIITLPNPLSLSATSNVFIDIASASSVGSVDATTGTTHYGGTLTVSAVDGFMPSLGNSFSICSHSAFSGAFDMTNSAGLGAGQSFEVNIGATDVIATVN